MPASRRGPLRPQEFLTPKPGQPLGFYSVSVVDVAATTTVAATVTGDWAGTANDGLQGFPLGQGLLADGPDSSFVAATAVGDWQATADSGRQGFPLGQIVIGPAVSAVTANAVVKPLRVGGGTLPIHVSPVAPHWPIPPLPIYQPEPWRPTFTEPIAIPAVDNRPAILALYVAGALEDEEFAVLLAAA